MTTCNHGMVLWDNRSTCVQLHSQDSYATGHAAPPCRTCKDKRPQWKLTNQSDEGAPQPLPHSNCAVVYLFPHQHSVRASQEGEAASDQCKCIRNTSQVQFMCTRTRNRECNSKYNHAVCFCCSCCWLWCNIDRHIIIHNSTVWHPIIWGGWSLGGVSASFCLQ